jgi:hypothetical protein
VNCKGGGRAHTHTYTHTHTHTHTHLDVALLKLGEELGNQAELGGADGGVVGRVGEEDRPAARTEWGERVSAVRLCELMGSIVQERFGPQFGASPVALPVMELDGADSRVRREVGEDVAEVEAHGGLLGGCLCECAWCEASCERNDGEMAPIRVEWHEPLLRSAASAARTRHTLSPASLLPPTVGEGSSGGEKGKTNALLMKGARQERGSR